MSDKKIATINIFSSLFLQFVAILSGFILPRLILTTFGSEINGLVSSITQFLNYISLFEGGVSVVIMSSLYIPLAENNMFKVSGIIKAANHFFRKLGIIFVVYAATVSIAYPLIVKTSFSWLFVASLAIILASNLFIQYMFSITYRTLLIADRKGYIVYFSQSAFFIINLILVYIVLKVYPEIHILKLVSALAFAIQPLLYNLYVKKHYPINHHIQPDEEALAQKWDGFGQNFALFIHNNTDVVVLSLLSNLKDVSVYSIYFMITNSVKTIVNSVSNAILPSIGNVYVSSNIDELNDVFDQYVFLIYTISTVIFSCTAILLIPFVHIYTHNIKDTNYIQPLFGFILMAAYAIECYREPFIQITYIAKHFKETSKYAYIEAILNIVISVILVWKLGLVGVAIGTVISVVYRLLSLVIYTSQYILHRPVIKFIKNFMNSVITIIISYLVIIHFIDIQTYTSISWFVYTIKSVVIVLCIEFIDIFIVDRKHLKTMKRFMKSDKSNS